MPELKRYSTLVRSFFFWNSRHTLTHHKYGHVASRQSPSLSTNFTHFDGSILIKILFSACGLIYMGNKPPPQHVDTHSDFFVSRLCFLDNISFSLPVIRSQLYKKEWITLENWQLSAGALF
jgi:hypothetical protein